MRAILPPDRAFASVGVFFARQGPLIDASIRVPPRLAILAIIDGNRITAAVRASRTASLVPLGERPDQPAVVRLGALSLERIVHECIGDLVILLEAFAIEIALDGTCLVAVEVFGRGIRADACAAVARADMVAIFAHGRGTREEDIAVTEAPVRRKLAGVADRDIPCIRAKRRNTVAIEVAGLPLGCAAAGDTSPLNAFLGSIGAGMIVAACIMRRILATAMMADLLVRACARHAAGVAGETFQVVAKEPGATVRILRAGDVGGEPASRAAAERVELGAVSV